MRQAFKIALPVMFGYFPVAVTFGLLANQQGVSAAMTMGLSALVFAGASQFVALTLIASGATGFASVFLTVWLINLRHFVLSFAYLPHARGWSLFERLRFFPFLTDETFAVLVADSKTGSQSAPSFKVAIFNYLTWVAGTAVGFYSGEFVPNPQKIGLDFALTALFIGIIVLFLKKRSHVVTLVTTVILSLLFYGVMEGGKNSVLIAALLGSALGYGAERWQRRVA